MSDISTFNDILNNCDNIDDFYEEIHTCNPIFDHCINNLYDYFCEHITNLPLEQASDLFSARQQTSIVAIHTF